MVDGFGLNGSLSEKRLFPTKLLCYRMFRFRPRPGVDTGPFANEWRAFVQGLTPRQNMPSVKWRAMQEMAMLKGLELAELYYGKDEWQPCLTAASYGNAVYAAGEHEAFCAHGLFDPEKGAYKHAAPEKDCTCGFWAYYKPDSMDIGGTTGWTALAAVEVWGDVVLGTKGVRAQKMKILGVMVPKEVQDTEHIEIVQEWHKVVAELHVPQYGNKAEFLLMHPPQDVSELLPKPPPPPPPPVFLYDENQIPSSPVRYPQQWTAPLPSANSYWTYTYNSTAPFITTTSMSTPYLPTSFTRYLKSCYTCNYRVVAEDEAFAKEAMAKHVLDAHSLPVTEP